MTRGEQLIQVLIEAAQRQGHHNCGSLGEKETQEAREALMKYVTLLEGWYPFPPDDEETQP